MSVPAEAEEEPYEVLYQNQLSSDQAHIMPQLFGWMAPEEQRERSRYLAVVARAGRVRSPAYAGPLAGRLWGGIPGEAAEEQVRPTTEA